MELVWSVLVALAGSLSGALPQQETAATITIPGLTANRPAVTGHQLAVGESIDDIATLYATTLAMLETLNLDLASAGPGTEIAVPAPGPAPALLPCGDLLAPLDKDHEIPDDCVPELASVPARAAYTASERLEPRALAAFMAMVDAAAGAGHEVVVRSSYRSWQEQEITFQSHVERMGFERASMVSAQPGHSEHQLGTTVDVTNAEVGYQLDVAFGETAAGRWLAENAWRYGFVRSYPQGAEDITGYVYEPWHFRWVGEKAAAAVRASGLTLHEWTLDEWRPGRYLLPNP